ncbi:secretion protein [uncultured Ruegeria sp.]|uniref:secretion protein n=1 Tax=uncultured Ruegeria sp. TaxID=259304 RepID=UPI002608FF9D|nr:secretion protein [uncultured Ruegeria sp.]
MRTFLNSVALLASVSLLSGCDAIKGADDMTGDLSWRAGEQASRLRAAQRGQLHEIDRPYYGKAIRVERDDRNGEPLPEHFEKPDSISVTTGGSEVEIKKLAELISQQAGMPVNIRTVYSQPNNQILRIPIRTTMSVDHEGPLSKLLDQIGARMDLAWSYDGEAITFDRMITKRYRLSLPVGGSALETRIGGVVGSGGADGNRSVTFSRDIEEQNAWTDLNTQLEAVAPPPAQITLGEGMGRVSVFGPPSVQARAAKVIADFEEVYSTRIAIEVAVFFIDTSKTDTFAVGLEGSGTHGAISGAVGALTGSGVATLTNDFGSINFQALAKNSSVVDYRLASTIAQSGTIAPIALPASVNYVSSIGETKNEDGTTTTTVETDTIDTGISIHALPRLVRDNRIQLSLTLVQNDLTELEDFDTGDGTVQLPKIDQRAIQNDSLLAPGETLILSGYEQDKATRSNTGTGIAKFIGLGGRIRGEVGKVRMVVFVRPAIIPAAD